MRIISDIIHQGSRLVSSGRVYILTEDLGNGLWAWRDNQDAAAIGTMQFDEEQTENEELIVLD